MKNTLTIGSIQTVDFVITEEKTVPHLYPELTDFQEIPNVFATGYMVGLMEWCCIRSLADHLEEGEGSLGTRIDVTHLAATPVGAKVTVQSTVTAIQGRKITWHVIAKDNLDVIGEGTIGRNVVLWEKFNRVVENKTKQIQAQHS